MTYGWVIGCEITLIWMSMDLKLMTQIDIRQQAITWANIDLDLCHHTAPLGHNELIGWLLHSPSSSYSLLSGGITNFPVARYLVPPISWTFCRRIFVHAVLLATQTMTYLKEYNISYTLQFQTNTVFLSFVFCVRVHILIFLRFNLPTNFRVALLVLSLCFPLYHCSTCRWLSARGQANSRT